MSDAKEQAQQAEAHAGESGEGQKHEQAFTQADVDRIVADRLKREREKITAKYADYDQLREKAGQAKTAEDRIAELEQRYAAAETKALRSGIAAEFGISAEDRDLFLTGSDEDTLRAQAQRLADRESERKKRNNHVPSEGTNPRPTDDKDAVARAFFGI